MAPAEGSPYLPALVACLDGKKQVLSWRQAYEGLAGEGRVARPHILSAFLNCAATRESLKSCLSTNSQSLPDAQADFDSYTAAINIPHNGNGRYDVQQIKCDAKWLDKHVGADPVAALRVVMLEWQTRPDSKLEALKANVDSTSIGRGSAVFKSLSQSSALIRDPSSAINNPDFDAETARQARLFRTWAEEHQYRSKVLEHLGSCFLHPTSPKLLAQQLHQGDAATDLEGAVAEAATAVLKHWEIQDGPANFSKDWLSELVGILRLKLEKMFNGFGAFEELDEEAERSWSITQASEAVHLLRLAASVLKVTSSLPPPSGLDSWFNLMDEVNFFDEMEPPFLGSDEAPLYCLRSLATTVSLAILNVPFALSLLPELQQAPLTGEKGRASYIYSVKTIEGLTQILLRGAMRGCSPSQPIALVWSILLQNIRAKALASQEQRETRQSQRAIENLGHSQASDSDSNESYSGRSRPVTDRRTSFGSDSSQQTTLLESITECVQKIDTQEDVIQTLARSAFSGQGALSVISDIASTFCLHFGQDRQGLVSRQIRTLLLQTVEATLGFVEYGSDVVSAILNILGSSRSRWEKNELTPENVDEDPVKLFLSSSVFMDRIFDQSIFRFPYELTPLLALCSALIDLPEVDTMNSPALEVLKHLPSFAASIPDNGYALLDDDANFIILKVPLQVDWSPSSSRSDQNLALLGSTGGSPYEKKCPVISEGSQGLSLTESKPIVARFNFQFAGYSFIGRILQRASNAYFSADKYQIDVILEPVVEILSLLTAIFDKTTREELNGSDEAAQFDEIFESLNNGVDDGNDIISVLFNIMENELQEQHPTSPEGDATEVLVACMHFAQALVLIQPSRIWPFLGRSSLLGLDGVESRLLSVVASREAPTGRFPLLRGSVHLFEALVKDVVRNCVSRRRASSAVVRFGETQRTNMAAGIRDAMMAKILYTFTKLMIDVFETAKSWRAVSNSEIADIHVSICRTLDDMLRCVFDVDDSLSLADKLTGVLAPAVEYAIGVFLLNHHNNVPIEPFLQGLEMSSLPSGNVLEAVEIKSRVRMTVSLIDLAEHLIRINAYLGRPRCQLEEQLFLRANLLIKVFASQPEHRLPIIRLFHALLLGPSQGQHEQLSLLGHLGQDVAINFINMLANVDQPLGNIELATATWRLLSAVVTQQQQWFAILLLSGETAREYLRKKDCAEQPEGHSRSLLDVATNKLRHLEVLEPREAASILEFIAVAADHWPWVSRKLEHNANLIKEFTGFIERIGESRPTNSAVTSVPRAFRLQMAASITKILAIIVHRGNDLKDTSFAKQVAPCLKHLAEEGPSTTEYNASLHASLQKNFQARFSNSQVGNLKRTSIPQADLGASFYYDIEFANKVFGFDKSWSRGDGRGFADEFARANVNLSYVQAQISLFGAWKSLAVEMALATDSDKATRDQIARVINACLEANHDSSLPEQIFGKLAHSRAELAFVLLQNLTQHSPAADEVKSVVAPAWNLLQSRAPDLAVALSGDDAEYIRVLLKILYLALQSYGSSGSSKSGQSVTPAKKLDPSTVAVVLDILGNGVARGFRSVVSLLHEDPSRVLPVDLAVLNAILRTCLRIPDIDRQTEQLVMYFADNSTTHYATALFSWADRLLVDDDPVYGSLSIAFLLELSTVPCLAECIVLGGSLGQLSSSNLTACLTRPGGSGPFDQPVRVHAIWSRGLLPLAINLLHAIGAPIAGDIAAFLNQFKAQLERGVNSLAPKVVRGAATPRSRYLTLSVAAEVHSLAILCAILDAFRDAGSGAGLAPGEVPSLSIDRPLLASDLETALQRRNALRDDVVATDAREEGWSRQKPADALSGCESRLEEKIVEELKSALHILGAAEQ